MNIILKEYIADLENEFKDYNLSKLSKDIMSGITVAAVALPLSLAFGVSSGANAAAGLITAIISGLFISIFSGASYQISGLTGAMTAILIPLIAQYGLQGIFIISFLAGLILFILGILKLGKLVNLIPLPVIIGFTSGISLLIAVGQIDNLLGISSEGNSALIKFISYFHNGFNPNLSTICIGLLVIAIMVFYPKKLNAKVPSSLIAIIIATILTLLLGLDIEIVGEIPQTLLPETRLHFFDFKNLDFMSLLSPAITIATLGMIESLLCGTSASRMKKESFNANQELVAQGLGNMLIPFFGGIPATGAIARTGVAIKSGAQTRLTGIFHALLLLISMFILAPIMSKLPLAALAGVLITIAWRMNEWSAIKFIFKNKLGAEIVQFLATMFCTVIFDLITAIIIGISLAMLFFILNIIKSEITFTKVNTSNLSAKTTNINIQDINTIICCITGTVFFANADVMVHKLDKLNEYDKIIFSLSGLSSIDYTGAKALIAVLTNYHEMGQKVLLCGMQKNVEIQLNRCGIFDIIDRTNVFTDVDDALITVESKSI